MSFILKDIPIKKVSIIKKIKLLFQNIEYLMNNNLEEENILLKSDDLKKCFDRSKILK